MGLGPEKEDFVLQKREKKKKNKRNEKIKMGLVEAISLPRDVGDNRLRLMKDDKEYKRKLEKEKKVESVRESKLNVILEKDVVNGKDHLGGKKNKRKLELNERNNDLEFISKEETNKVRKEKGDKLKKRKCKERKKETREKGKGVVSSTPVEVFMDKEEGVKQTNGLRPSEKEHVSNIKEYEGQQEKQRKQKKVKKKKMKELEYCEKTTKTKKSNKQTEELGNCEGDNIDDNKELEQVDEERKKQEKKDNRVNEHHDIEKRSIVRSQKFEQEEDYVDGSSEENVEYKKKGRSRVKQEKNLIEGCSVEFLIGNLTGDEKAISDHKEIAYNEGRPSLRNKKGGRDKGVIDDVMEKREKSKRKRTKLVNDVEEKRADEGHLRTIDRGGSTSGHSKDFEPKKSSKRVKFSDHVEVFPSSDATDVGKEHEEQNLVLGKRFSKKEDQMIKDAVHNYIEAHGLGENGLHMVLNCMRFPETRGCWKEIATTLPWRPKHTIYLRAHNLLTRGELSAEDKTLIMKFHNEYGPDWSRLAKSVGKHRIQLKDHWRQRKHTNLKKGHWSQDEYRTLFELVNLDLQMKVHEEKNTKYGMLRDNISWTAISDKLGTRSASCCCRKWYHMLTSSMVKSGEWDDSDDYRLMDGLLKLDACCVEDVDWDNLIGQRSGDICLKRWKQMCLHIGNHGIKPFAEQVEVLAKRYCPDLLEVREAVDSRPIV